MRPVSTVCALIAMTLVGCGASAKNAQTPGAEARVTEDPNSGSVAGVMRYADSESPVGFATIVAMPSGTAGDSADDQRSTVVSDSEGGYKFDDLAPGTYDVVAYYTDQSVQFTNVPVAAGKTTEVNFEVQPAVASAAVYDYRKPASNLHTVRHAADVRGSIHGECIDQVSSDPLAGAVVTATKPDLRDALITICDDDGLFQLPHLPSGVYTLSVSYNLIGIGNYELRRSNVNVQRGETTEIKLILDTKTPD